MTTKWTFCFFLMRSVKWIGDWWIGEYGHHLRADFDYIDDLSVLAQLLELEMFLA